MIDHSEIVEKVRPLARAAAARYEDIVQDLQRQRAELLKDAGKSLSGQLDIELFPDLNDQASAEADQHFLLSLKERERALLQQIDQALTRLAGNTYGICESCGIEIPYKRLKARPMTTLCVECKAQQELEDKMRR